MQQRGQNVIALDLARGLAALCVLFGHVRNSAFVEYGALPASSKGVLVASFFGATRLAHEAVFVFFVLRGFLVGGQIVRHVRGGRFSVQSYAIDRATRIWVPLVPACLLTIAVGRFVLGAPPNWPQAALNMIGLNESVADTLPLNGNLWTLAYEIWFYVLAGAVGYFFCARRPSPLAFLVIATSICIFSVLSTRFLLFWTAGALASLLLDNPRQKQLALVGAVAFIVGAVAMEIGGDSKSFVSVPLVSAPVAEALLCLGLSATLPFLCSPAVNGSLAFLRTLAVYLSGLSYTLYLVHAPINAALDLMLPRAGGVTWISMGAFAARLAIIGVFVQIFYLAFEANTVHAGGS